MNHNFLKFRWFRTWRKLGSVDFECHRKIVKVKMKRRMRFSSGRMFFTPPRVNYNPLSPKYLLKQRRLDDGPNKRREARRVREEYFKLRAKIIARRKAELYIEAESKVGAI